MGLFKNFMGATQTTIIVGGSKGIRLLLNGGNNIIEFFRNHLGSALPNATVQALEIQDNYFDFNNLIPFHDLQGRIVNVDFVFTVASNGTITVLNTGTNPITQYKFGLCAYSADTTNTPRFMTGRIYYCKSITGTTIGQLDESVSFVQVPVSVATALTTRASFTTSGISLDSNWLYILEGGSWKQKCKMDVDNIPGFAYIIKVPFDYTDGVVSSTASVPANAKITRQVVDITTAFVDATSDPCTVDWFTSLSGGLTNLISNVIEGFEEVDVTTVDQYDKDQRIDSINGGTVQVHVSNGGENPAVHGAGDYYLIYHV